MQQADRHSSHHHQAIASAQRVLEIEASAIKKLAGMIDQSFVGAVELLDATRNRNGRIIVSGMGKSGHIARKIAATLASTGSPALFVHPAEASHGDLGMVTPQDCVLALSNSGETSELADLITYCKREKIGLIAMTSRALSALGEQADHILLLPAEPEACPNGLAPTTSTTMMLAMGDALAIALLEQRGFKADQFHHFHPGGRLGRRLLKVSDLMHVGKALPCLPIGRQMTDAILEMSTKSFGCVAIINQHQQLEGIITDGDLRRHMGAALLAERVENIMTRNPTIIRPNALAAEALAVMNERKITALFVVEDQLLCGLIHIHDCLRAGLQ